MRRSLDTWNSHLTKKKFPEKKRGKELFEDHEYITKVLGIELPLNEAGKVVLNSKVRDEILTEQMLLESWMLGVRGWLATQKKKLASAGGAAANFVTALELSAGAGGTLFLSHWTDYVEAEIYLPAKKLIEEIVNKWFPKVSGAVKSAGSWLKEKITNGIEGLLSAAAGWKKFFLIVIAIIAFKEILNKLNLIPGFGQSVVDAGAGVTSAVVNGLTDAANVTSGGIEQFSKGEGNFVKWMGWLGGTFAVFGTIAKVIQLLQPATDKVLKLKQDGKLYTQGAADPDAELKAKKEQFLQKLSSTNRSQQEKYRTAVMSVLAFYNRKAQADIIATVEQLKIQRLLGEEHFWLQYSNDLKNETRTVAKRAVMQAYLEDFKRSAPAEAKNIDEFTKAVEEGYQKGMFHIGGKILSKFGAVAASAVATLFKKVDASYEGNQARFLLMFLWLKLKQRKNLPNLKASEFIPQEVINYLTSKNVQRYQQKLDASAATGRFKAGQQKRRLKESARSTDKVIMTNWKLFKKGL